MVIFLNSLEVPVRYKYLKIIYMILIPVSNSPSSKSYLIPPHSILLKPNGHC